MISLKNDLQPMSGLTRQGAVTTSKRYLDDVNDGALVIPVQHDWQKLPTTDQNLQKEDKDMMLRYRRGMMVVRQNEKETQRELRLRDREMHEMVEQTEELKKDDKLQGRRFKRGMMINDR